MFSQICTVHTICYKNRALKWIRSFLQSYFRIFVRSTLLKVKIRNPNRKSVFDECERRVQIISANEGAVEDRWCLVLWHSRSCFFFKKDRTGNTDSPTKLLLKKDQHPGWSSFWCCSCVSEMIADHTKEAKSQVKNHIRTRFRSRSTLIALRGIRGRSTAQHLELQDISFNLIPQKTSFEVS